MKEIEAERALTSHILNVEPEYPDGALFCPIPPPDDAASRTEALLLADNQCTVKQSDCLGNIALRMHQIELRVVRGEHLDPKILQTTDNIVVCCMACFDWIRNNQEEAKQLGYLHR